MIPPSYKVQPVDSLKPYERNARTHTKAQVKQIAASIKEFGFTNPIIVDEHGRVIAGHGRLEAAAQLKLAEVPTIVVSGLSENQRRALVLADNKLALNAGWDNDLLKGELLALKEAKFDIDLTGFSANEYLDLLGPSSPAGKDVEDAPDPEAVELRTKEGDVWKLGDHVVVCGDSCSADTYAKLLGRRKVDLVVQRRGADLEIEAVFQQPSWSFGFVESPRCEMSLSVPHKLLGHFRTTNGPVVVTGLEGYARCETTNGDVRVREVTGEVHAETTNGTLDARNLKARLRGETTNGRILLDDVEGGVVAETTNGSIRARNLDGWGEGIVLETTNGSIEVELGRAAGELRASNSNGSLDIRIPGAEVVELSKHSAHLRIPGKAQRIVLETTNGSIRVK